MKNILSLIIVVLLGSVATAQDSFEPNVLLLKIAEPDLVQINGKSVIGGSAEFKGVLNSHHLERSKKLSTAGPRTKGVYRLEFPENSNLEAIIAALRNIPDVADVTVNHYGRTSANPDDPIWLNGDQWSLALMEVDKAWDIILPNNQILVGIMDSGINKDHYELNDNIWINPAEPIDGIDNDFNGYIDDVNGWNFTGNLSDISYLAGIEDYHGTRVAGVISAETYNGTEMAGIAGGWKNVQTGVWQPGVRLIGLHIVFLGEVPEQHAIEAIVYLTALRNMGNTVIANMSFGYCGSNPTMLRDAVFDARDAGVILVAAAGNLSSCNPVVSPILLPAPARWEGVLAIGASHGSSTPANERRSLYSLYDSEGKLLAVAPVDSTINVTSTYDGNNIINTFSGTSAAAPLAVGVIALLLSKDPTLTYQEIEDIIKATSDKIGPYTYSGGRTAEVGYGRINAFAAVSAVQPPVIPPNPSVPQNLTITSVPTGGGMRNPKLAWTANTESGLEGYEIYRKTDTEPTWFLAGNVLASSGDTYFIDVLALIKKFLNNDRAYYKVRAYNTVGVFSDYTPVVSIPIWILVKPALESAASEAPKEYHLAHNIPNPFNPVTRIEFALPEAGLTRLIIYDLRGREVAKLVDGELSAGIHNLTWDASKAASGIYIYRLTSGSFVATKKMVLLK